MGCAHVGFESRQDAIKVTEAHNESPIVIGDREVRVDYARPWKNKYPVSPQRAVKDRHEPSSTIFVGNIPYHATREDICEALKPLGEVVDIRIGALLCRIGQQSYMLNLGSHSIQEERDPRGVWTCRLYEYL